MKKRIVVFVMVLFVLAACSETIIGKKENPADINITTTGSTIHAETSGNLKPNQILDCVDITELTNNNTPADMFTGFDACMKQGDFEKALNLRYLAAAYGYYDAARVSDRSARQAITVMNQKSLLPYINTEAHDRLLAFNEQNSNRIADQVCDFLKQNGAPEYHPNYMIYHGIKAFTGIEGDGLDANFNHQEAWQKIMKPCNDIQ